MALSNSISNNGSDNLMFKYRLSDILRKGIEKTFKKNINESDINTIAELYTITSFPDSSDNPKSVIRKLSDYALQFLVKKGKQIKKSPIFSKLFSIITVEWFWRNHMLQDDWIWISSKPESPAKILCSPNASIFSPEVSKVWDAYIDNGKTSK
jgi:hypothetical protein